MSKVFKIAIAGFGTVGGGVGDVLHMNAESIAKKAGKKVEIKYILDKFIREDTIYRDRYISDFATFEQDPEVELMVETIGGSGIAYEFTKRALMAGKHVVTANKQLVAEHGRELLRIAAEHNVCYLFEASVGGGIPVLHPLTQCMSANQVRQIYGIMNGTTNYILSQMVYAGATFADALKEAQQKGYAEADPTADVEGHDACRKTCILANLAYGKEVKPQDVDTCGITKVDLADVALLQKKGYRVKLLGRVLGQNDGSVAAYVSPHVLPESNPIAHVDDVFNAIVVDGNATDEVMFFGKGAGSLPTASAVVSDIIEIASRETDRPVNSWDEDAVICDVKKLPMRFYLRCADSAARIAEVLGAVELLQEGEECAVITGEISREELENKAAALSVKAQWPVL